MAIISSGQRVLTDLNDAKALQLFLSSNQPKTQVYNTNSGVFTPDWSSNKPVITAELYAPGTNTNIISSAKSVNWYEDNGNTPLVSGGNYTVGSGALTINGNIIGQEGVAFDGSTGNITVNNASAINITGSAFTFETWVFPRDYTNPAEVYLCQKDNQYEVALRGNPRGQHTLQAAFFVGSGWNWIDSGSAVPLTAWTHVAVTYDGTNIYFYLNGVLVNTVANHIAGPIVSGTSNLTFASRQTTLYTSEILREARLWNVVRTQANIFANMNTSLIGNESGLVGYWKMNEGTGTTVHDSTANANNGTLSSGASWIVLGNANKVITCEVVYTDPAVNTDLTVRTDIEFTQTQVGTTGLQGYDAPEGVLTNDTAVITTANDGTGGTYGAPNTQSTLHIYQNGNDVTGSYAITQTRTNVTVTEATTSNVATVTAMSADTGSVVFTATRPYFPTITKTFSLAKSKMGVVGQTPTSYWLNLSAGTIAVADDGSYTPGTVTVSAESQAGTALPAAYSGRFIISESTDGNNFTNKYTSGADESSHTYTPSSGLQAIKVTLYQAGGTSNKLDEQNIMLVGNGKNSVMVSAWTPTGNVIRNAGNTVTAEADLYNGGQPVTGSNYRWVKGNGSATSVIAGSGYEDLDLGKRNIASGTATPYVRTSFTGLDNNVSVLSYTIDPTLVKGTIRFSCDVVVKGVTTSASGTPAMYFQFYTQDSGGTQLWNSTSGGTSTISLTDGTYHMSGVYSYNYANTITSASMQIRANYITGGTVTITNFKMEAGSTETPWVAAYTDNKIDPNDSTLYGKNLLQRSDFITNNWYGTGGTGTILTFGNDAVYGDYAQFSYQYIISNYKIPTGIINAGDTVTISFNAKMSGTTTNYSFYLTDGSGHVPISTQIHYTASTSWQRFYFTFTAQHASDGSQELIFYGSQSDTNLIYLSNVKIEKTGYATDYTPAPEDNLSSYPDNSAGANKWIFRYYTDGNNASDKIYGYSDFSSLTPVYQTLLTDQVNLQQNVADYYVGYYKTAVYVSTAKTINFTTNVDDTLNILVNGLQQFYQLGTQGGATKTIPLSLQAGWNSIELINQEITGADGIWNTNPLSSLVDEMNCNYALDFGSLKGNYGLTGYNTSSMVVNTNAVTDTDMFMCLVTYRGSTYKDSVTIDDITDPIVVIINGMDMFKNGQGTNTYTATLFQNGVQIDPSGTIYTYQWYVYNSDGSLDATFGGTGSKTGQTITVDHTDINVSGSLQCQVYL